MDPSERASETADVWVIPPSRPTGRARADLKGPAGLFAPPSLPRSVPPSRGSDFEVQKQILILLLHLPPWVVLRRRRGGWRSFGGYSDHVLCIIPFLIPFHRLLFAGLDVIWI